MQKRTLGRTGEHLTVIGFGGIIVMNETPEESAKRVRYAVEECGINYFDVAPSYGNAEERLGPALEPYRDGVFLACKTGKRDAEGAREELHASLERLRTDHLDLYQLHAVSSMADVEQILGDGGALETFIAAREQGLVRYLGFSAHSEEAALALMDAFDFDTLLFPFNWACWYQNGFGKEALAKARAKNMGILALKALAKRRLGEDEERPWAKSWYAPVDTFEEAELGLRFTLSLPDLTAAVSPGHMQFLEWACQIVEDYQPLAEEGAATLKEWTQEVTALFPQ